MNTAQKIRIWAALGVSALLGVSVSAVAYFATNPLFNDPSSGLDIYDVTAIKSWIGAAVWFLVTDAILAAFIIFRMYKPLPPDHKPVASGQITWNGVTYYSDGRREPVAPEPTTVTPPAPRQSGE